MEPKNIVITGTSRGIGLQLLRQLADAGHRILSLTRNASKIEALGLPSVVSRTIDFETPGGLDALKAILDRDFPEVDIVINNAGALVKGDFGALGMDAWEQVYRVNVFGPVMLMQACLPRMKRGGHVVNISSMGGVQGSAKFPGLSAYSSSKGALITLTELLAEEYKEQGVHFNVLALGAVQTEMLEAAFPGFQAPVSAAEMAAYIADFALNAGRFYNGKILQVSSTTP